MEAKEFEESFVKGAIKLCSKCRKGRGGCFYDDKAEKGPWIPQCLEHQFSRILSKAPPAECLLKLELVSCKKEIAKYLKRHCAIHYIAFKRKRSDDEVVLAKIVVSADGVRIGRSLYNNYRSSGKPGKSWVYNRHSFESFDNDNIKLLAHGDFRKVFPYWWKWDHKGRLRRAEEAVKAVKEELLLERRKLAGIKAEKLK